MYHEIYELFIQNSEKHPFSISKFYKFLGYKRKDYLIEYLDRNYKETWNHSSIKWDTINVRKTKEWYLSKSLFIELKMKKGKKDKEWIDTYCAYLKFKATQFKKSRKLVYLHDSYFQVRGHYYAYSLTTLRLAKDLLIDPFDMYRFIVEHYFFEDYSDARYQFSRKFIPYISFNSKYYQRRNNFRSLLKYLIRDYKLEGWQLEALRTLYAAIDEMLDQQFRYDNPKKFKKKVKKVEITDEMRSIYKKLAKLCHPDKFLDETLKKEAHEIFTQVNKAFEKGDLETLNKLYKERVSVVPL